MNVLKSVTANRSEPDLIEAGKVENERKSSGFSFFGMTLGWLWDNFGMTLG